MEKDFNFYVSTPVKNKIFFDSNVSQEKTNLIKTNLGVVSTKPSLFNLGEGVSGFYDAFERKVKKGIAEGAYKKELPLGTLSNFSSNVGVDQSLENLLSSYSSSSSYYAKSIKNSIKNIDDLRGLSGLWSLTRNNSVGRVYPNSNNILLSGNLLIAAKEGEGAFNTNLVSIKDPS